MHIPHPSCVPAPPSRPSLTLMLAPLSPLSPSASLSLLSVGEEVVQPYCVCPKGCGDGQPQPFLLRGKNWWRPASPPWPSTQGKVSTLRSQLWKLLRGCSMRSYGATAGLGRALATEGLRGKVSTCRFQLWKLLRGVQRSRGVVRRAPLYLPPLKEAIGAKPLSPYW